MKVVLATHNRKKLVELARILTPAPSVQVVSLNDVAHYDEPVENEPTFAGNALLKARTALEKTGLPSIGDDSGLCVDALNGMPGVLSARWSGQPKSDERNVTLLLDQLLDVPDSRRSAYFICNIAYVLPDGSEHVVEGRVDGTLLRAPRGTNGFGYDPIFLPTEGHGLSMAELPDDEKDRISHRGHALHALAALFST